MSTSLNRFELSGREKALSLKTGAARLKRLLSSKKGQRFLHALADANKHIIFTIDQESGYATAAVPRIQAARSIPRN